MQTTLLGLAIALILALVTALVGPLLIDWGTYRALFEREASHIVGVDVRVTGAIDARLLPSPRLTLHDIEIGAASDKIRARSLGIEFALGALMRGEWLATDMQLAGPQVTLGIDHKGKLRAPTLAVAFDPDALSIERLSIEDGKVTLADAASGASVTLDRFWFHGEARSLLGPFKGEGAFAHDGELYPYRLSAGRYSDDGAVKLRVNVDPVNRPLSVELDGALTLADSTPRFEGTVNLTRPVGIAEPGRTRAARSVTPAWRVSGKLKARPQSALIENVEFQYGNDDQGIRLTGVADLTFGKRPLVNVVLSGRQIDLDRAFAQTDGTRQPPAATLRALAELSGGLFRPNVPMQIGLGIDQVTLGGSSVQNVRGDITGAAGRWELDRLEFRAPGFTQVRLSGALDVGDGSVVFKGPAEIDARDAKALTAWLEGRGDVGTDEARPLRLRGDLTLGSEKIAIERLSAEFDRKNITGRLAYVWAAGGRPPSLDAALSAPELDLDVALAFGKALAAGSKFERPRDMTIAADIGRAIFAGITMRDARAQLKVDRDGLQIDRLSVADLGGAALSATGRIRTAGSSPQGNIRVDLDAPDLTPVLALLSRVAPSTARTLELRAAAMAPAKLRAQFTLEGAAQATEGKLAIEGSLGPMQVALNAQGRVDPVAMQAGDIQLNGKVASPQGARLVAMLGLDRVFAAGDGPGTLTFNAKGPASGSMNVDAKLSTPALEATADGTARPFADAPSASLRANIVRADASPLRGGQHGALPVAYQGRIALAGNELTFSDINASVGSASLRGRVALTVADPLHLKGEIDADKVEGPALVAAAIGMQAAAASPAAGGAWSSEPFADGVVGALTGEVVLKARRVVLLPQLSAREFRTNVKFGNDEITFEDIAGEVDRGRLTGRLAFQEVNGGIKARAKLALAGADAAGVLAAGARPAITGTLSLSAELEGSGRSPVALIGSLQGSGKISLANGQLAGLDPRAFDSVTRAVDHGLTIDNARIADIVRRTLGSGQLSVKHGEGTLALSAGQVRLENVSAEVKDAAVSLSGNLDLIDGIIDARLVLSGAGEAGGVRPDIYMSLKGPFTDPARTIDVSALTGWLTLRAVENQAKKLQAAERAAQPQAATRGAPPLSPPPMAPASPPDTSALERAPALPPPLIIGPLPTPLKLLPPGVSVGHQN